MLDKYKGMMIGDERWEAYLKAKAEKDALPYPLTVFMARYGGTYEGGWWIALNHQPGDERLQDATGSDVECETWFRHYEEMFKPIGRGDTPDEAIADLKAKLEAEPEKAWPNRI